MALSRARAALSLPTFLATPPPFSCSSILSFHQTPVASIQKRPEKKRHSFSQLARGQGMGIGAMKNQVAMMKKLSEKMMISDKVPEGYELIYRLKLENYLKPGSWFSFLGGITFCLVVPFNLYVGINPGGGAIFGNYASAGQWEHLGFWCFLLLNVLMIRHITRSVPLRIYHSERKDDFIMILEGLKPWKPVQLTLRSGDVANLELPQSKDWMTFNRFRHVTTDGRKIFLSPSHFQSTWFYNKMTGTHFEEQEGRR